MASLPKYHLSPEEYLAIERKAEFKSEYIDGEIYAMPGASPRHNLIVGNIIGELHARLKTTNCAVYPSDLKVRVPDSSKFFYPDVSVVCGEAQLADSEKDVVLNPVLIVEVLSDSTESFDRGAKFQAYQEIPTLNEYVLVAQDKYMVEHYVRQPDGWLYTKPKGTDATLTLAFLECHLKLDEVYRKVL